MDKSRLHLLLISSIAVIFFVSVVVSIEDDIRCLQGLKKTLDPQDRLSSWNLSNSTAGFICKFLGASCWNDQENRLISLILPDLELSGVIPDSLQFCPSIQTLDLSKNDLSGTIPSRICEWLPYLVSLDLSGNQFSGPIPLELVNCKFLNYLHLGNNSLSGPIPYQLSRLSRLKQFSVENNDLSGQIPAFLSNFNSANFDGNSGLCGRPLRSKCGGVMVTDEERHLIIIIAAGFLIGFIASFCLCIRIDVFK